MKHLFVAFAAVALLLIVGCKDSSTAPVSGDGSSQSSSATKGFVDDGNRAGRVEGTVNGIDLQAGTVTIGRTLVQTNASTKIERNGFHARLSSFVLGDFGQARLIGTSNVASKVEARGQ